MSFTLDDLAALIKSRRVDDASTSYTKTLLDSGMPRIAKKFGEEAVETVIAAMEDDRSALVNEAADTLYHLLVMLEARDISLGDVLRELERRTKQSGLAEKAARGVKE
ncbi:phosphoribosyl-ATP diphosphatase [Methylocystis sp. L43]|jgi:phosphoribosyl-ATP pyrophosphohydrolase|uniref:phosphoribosyl-ATP diphosphatase n=1 Tax=unclassified Methylocystis TaxID=2625913 RepID=UPI0018C253AB|nr:MULTISPECIES: phosphoribosyl-ATP diphosphatase [unclassified Methylocystis]MBG0799622.1 phosphoribosyl-ATP diphosphatase [Methylocystis sp. L43]MBG0807405.1 phosphoribosyl-ATP diphosphatase [Methylocystis sp. H15]